MGDVFTVDRLSCVYRDGSVWVFSDSDSNRSGTMCWVANEAPIRANETPITAQPPKPDMTLVPPEALLLLLPAGCHDLVRWFHRMPGLHRYHLSQALQQALAAAGNGDTAQGLINVAAVGTKGVAHHPDPRAWEHDDRSLTSHFNSAIRHALRAMSQELDPDSGQPHWWHYAWRVVALWTLVQRGPVNDDRPVQQ